MATLAAAAATTEPAIRAKVMTAKPGMPYATSKIAIYLTKQIDALQGQKNQREIANEIGYEKPNMISMFKRGEAKVPIDKIPLLAKAIHVDPAHLFRLAMEQYWPDMNDAVKSALGNVVSAEEYKFAQMIRSKIKDMDDVSWTKDDMKSFGDWIDSRLATKRR